jgi:hypothetical protein
VPSPARLHTVALGDHGEVGGGPRPSQVVREGREFGDSRYPCSPELFRVRLVAVLIVSVFVVAIGSGMIFAHMGG